jgi:hypothetical protein
MIRIAAIAVGFAGLGVIFSAPASAAPFTEISCAPCETTIEGFIAIPGQTIQNIGELPGRAAGNVASLPGNAYDNIADFFGVHDGQFDTEETDFDGYQPNPDPEPEPDDDEGAEE